MYYSFFNIIIIYVKINEYLITIIDTIEISTVFYIVNKYNYLKLFKKCTNTQDFEKGVRKGSELFGRNRPKYR